MGFCRTIGIISVKGGVGKTTIAANMAALLSKEHHKRVLLVDANYSAPNLDQHINFIPTGKTLHHVLEGTAHPIEAIYEHHLGFHFMPSNQIHYEVSTARLKKRLEMLQKYYDFIILDSSPNINHEIQSVVMASDELFVVTTPDSPTLITTLKTVRLAKQNQTAITGIILNKVRSKDFELKLKDIEEVSYTPVLARIPDRDIVLKALCDGVPVVNYSKGTVANEMKKMVASVIGENYKDSFGNKMKKFMFVDHAKIEENREEMRKNKEFMWEV